MGDQLQYAHAVVRCAGTILKTRQPLDSEMMAAVRTSFRAHSATLTDTLHAALAELPGAMFSDKRFWNADLTASAGFRRPQIWTTFSYDGTAFDVEDIRQLYEETANKVWAAHAALYGVCQDLVSSKGIEFLPFDQGYRLVTDAFGTPRHEAEDLVAALDTISLSAALRDRYHGAEVMSFLQLALGCQLTEDEALAAIRFSGNLLFKLSGESYEAPFFGSVTDEGARLLGLAYEASPATSSALLAAEELARQYAARF